MCHTPDDRYTPRRYAEATGGEREAISRWLNDTGMFAETCKRCGTTEFTCNTACSDVFAQDRRTCGTDKVPSWIAQHTAHRDAALIPTDQPHAVAAYLRALLSQCTEYAHTPTGGPSTEVVPAERI